MRLTLTAAYITAALLLLLASLALNSMRARTIQRRAEKAVPFMMRLIHIRDENDSFPRSIDDI